MEISKLERTLDRLGEAVIEPTAWPDLIENISSDVGATGAILLQSDNRTMDVPRSDGVEELMNAYFRNEWHRNDIRDRSIPLLMQGRPVVSEADILQPDEIAKNPMYADAARFGFRWFAVVGFRANDALWGLSIQRTVAEGMFTEEEKQILAPLSQRLTEVATLSNAIGRIALSSAVNAMEHVRQAAIAIDRFGNVLDANRAAHRAFDEEFHVRGRRIVIKDKLASARVESLFDQLRAVRDTDVISSDPVVIRRTVAKPIVMRVMPVPPAAKTPFMGARALLVFSAPDAENAIRPVVLTQALGLTGAEARLAAELAKGASIEEIALKFSISRDTARNQLKAVFSKTGTHRQAELVSLLNQFQ